MLNVFITSAYDAAEPLASFRAMAEGDRIGVHGTIHDPDAADLLFFVENSHYTDDPLFRALRAHPLVRRYREKCFMYNEHDRPWCLLPGVYCSMPRRFFDPGRQRAGSYVTTLNPYVEEEAGKVENPDLLFSFTGARNAPVRRPILELRHTRGSVTDTTSFNAFQSPSGEERETAYRRYAETLGRSRFVLCPRGVGTSTFRLFETMQAGRVPVILSDGWMAPNGPEWDRFSIRVPEANVADIPALLEKREGEWEVMGRAARAAWSEWFAPDVKFHHMIESCKEILESRRRSEALSQRLPSMPYAYWWLRMAADPALRFVREGRASRRSSTEAQTR